MQQDFPDAYLLGEVWEDGTTKVAYSKRRRYLLGGGLHGLMNYPFRTAAAALPCRHVRRGGLPRRDGDHP